LNSIDSGGNGAGIGVFGSGGAGDRNVTVSHNTITGWGPTVLWHAIYVASTPNSTICGNTMGNPNATASGTSMLIKSLNTLICNNTINAAPNWGIHLYQETAEWESSPNGTRIYNNTFAGSTVGGIFFSPAGHSVSDINITSNDFDNLNIPIWIQGNSNTEMAINSTIQGNKISDSTYGIRVGSAGISYVDGVNILNNTFTSIGPYPACYVETGSIRGVIAYNVFSSCTTNIQNNANDTLIYGNVYG
jgi:hypothetical protein